MIDTIMFDLDGTLLLYMQQAFIDVYIVELRKVFAELGMDPGLSIEAMWSSTRAMIRNDGGALNSERFWQGFAGRMELGEARLAQIEAACDDFYLNGFHKVKTVMEPSDIPQRLVRAMAAKGYGVILATNPLFPMCGVESRLSWAGLDVRDFQYITHYANSSYCKPDPGYFNEIFRKTGKSPEQCLMAGNSPAEDMVAGELGVATFLVTNCLENESGIDISVYRNGTLAELEQYLNAFPDISVCTD